MDKILLYFYIDKNLKKKKIYKIKGQNFVHLSNLGSSTLVEIASHQGWEPLDKLLDKIFHLSSEFFHKVFSALGALRLDRIGQNAGQIGSICPICPILSTGLGKVTKVLCKMTKWRVLKCEAKIRHIRAWTLTKKVEGKSNGSKVDEVLAPTISLGRMTPTWWTGRFISIHSV